VAFGNHARRSHGEGADVTVTSGNGRDDRQSQHLPKPLAADGSVAEGALEERVKGGNGEQRLTHVKAEDTVRTDFCP